MRSSGSLSDHRQRWLVAGPSNRRRPFGQHHLVSERCAIAPLSDLFIFLGEAFFFLLLCFRSERLSTLSHHRPFKRLLDCEGQKKRARTSILSSLPEIHSKNAMV